MARKKKDNGKYRSGFEKTISKQVPDADYEPVKIKFTQPAKARTYTPDFRLKNGIFVETKGRMDDADVRAKMIWVRDQNPGIDIRFVFMDAKRKIYKGSPTSYGAWATKNGFLWVEKTIPQAWIDEPVKTAATSTVDSEHSTI